MENTRSETLDVYIDDEPSIIHVTRHNDNTAPSPLVFIHGWGMSPRSYHKVIEEIASHEHTVYAPELPGFGLTPPLAESHRDTYNRTVQHVQDMIEAAALPSPLPYVGHSFGAGIALSIAVNRPDLVSSLVLICPIGGAGPSVTTWLKLIAGVRNELPSEPRERMRDALPSMLRHPLSFAASGIAAKHADLTGALHTVTSTGLPVTLITADHDEIVPPGRLIDISKARTREVHGSHGWLLHDPIYCGILVQEALDTA